MALPDSTVSDPGTASANTAVVKTYTADASYRHAISKVICSYSAAPTGGKLLIQEGTGPTTLFDIDITSAGEHIIDLGDFRTSGKNLSMIITLAAGSGTVVGKLNVLGHKLVL
jgi:uncharacterized protein with beta-barrel porin domain